jgi:hypothetical protein
MARPIYSFLDGMSGKRFFVVWNTFGEVPDSLPMDLVTFLQYREHWRGDFLQVIHEIYPELIRTGSTLQGHSFEQMDPVLKQDCMDLLPLISDYENQAEFDAEVMKIEELFESERDFGTFKEMFTPLMDGIRKELPRPMHHYDSWAHSPSINNFADAGPLDRVLESFSQTAGLDLLNQNFPIWAWLQKGYFSCHRALMADLFCELGRQNLIEISRIPHVLRADDRIAKLFEAYGMSNLLPQNKQVFDPKTEREYRWLDWEESPELIRQFTNRCLHSHFGVSDFLAGKLASRSLLEISTEEIQSWGWCYPHFLNFGDGEGCNKYPFCYVPFTESEQFLFLGLFHGNAIHVFSKFKGHRVVKSEFYDIQFKEPNLLDGGEGGGSRWVYVFSDEQQQFQIIRTYHNHSIHEACIASGEGCYYFSNGWFNLPGNNALSPLCFTAGKRFTEGLAAVCFNGRWGYVNDHFEFVIPAQYGYASEFVDGFAKVFVLNDTFSHPKPDWIELPTWIPLVDEDKILPDSEQFLKRHPAFPPTQWLPPRVLHLKNWNETSLSDQYFGSEHGQFLHASLGRFVVMDKQGEVVFQNPNGWEFDLSEGGCLSFRDHGTLTYDFLSEEFHQDGKLLAQDGLELPRLKQELQSYELDWAYPAERLESKFPNLQDKSAYWKFFVDEGNFMEEVPSRYLSDEDLMLSLLAHGKITYRQLLPHQQHNVRFAEAELEKDMMNYHSLPASMKELLHARFDAFQNTLRERFGGDEELPF